jgi:benzoate membrane transport protein
MLKDFSVSALVAGFVTVLVGFTSSAVIVFQAADSLHASPAQIASWMFALGIGMGVTCIGLSLRYRAPVATAWSTPGAAMLITSAAGVSMSEAIGAFIVSALLITVAGFSGWFERWMNRLPLSLASAMLAGVLLRFGLDVFVAMHSQFELVFAMFIAYLVARRVKPRYAVMFALLVGVVIAVAEHSMHVEELHLRWAQPVWTAPAFSITALIGVALPLFVVTMTSQNIPGAAVLRASGYATPISPLIGWTGAVTFLLAPFGAYALNLAAITAAICTGREAHEDPSKRYVAAVCAGVFYILIGVFGATVAALLAAFPKELVSAIAGLALIATIGNGLTAALAKEGEREPAMLTFLLTASGIGLFGIGSAFWGLLAGVLSLAVMRAGRVT